MSLICFDEVWTHDIHIRWSRTKLSRAFKAKQRNLNLCRLSEAQRNDLIEHCFTRVDWPTVTKLNENIVGVKLSRLTRSR